MSNDNHDFILTEAGIAAVLDIACNHGSRFTPSGVYEPPAETAFDCPLLTEEVRGVEVPDFPAPVDVTRIIEPHEGRLIVVGARPSGAETQFVSTNTLVKRAGLV